MTIERASRVAAAQHGATAAEFALVLPAFLMLIFGAIEFGRLLWTQQALQETAIATARCLAIAQGLHPAGPCASGSANSYLQSVASGWGLSVPNSGIASTTTADCGGSSGGFSQVTLTYVFDSVVPGLVHLSGGGVALTASACYPNNG